MRRHLAGALLAMVVCAFSSTASTLTVYTDKALWLADLASLPITYSATAKFEGVAPAGGYVSPGLPFAESGIASDHTAQTPYFIVVDLGYASYYNVIGTGAVAQFGSRGYSGSSSYGRISSPNMIAAGLDYWTMNGVGDPYASDVSVIVGNSTATFIHLEITPSFIGLIADTPFNFFDIWADDEDAFLTFDNVQVAGIREIPEPGVLSLTGAGLALLGLLRARRR